MENREPTAWGWPFGVEGWRARSRWPERIGFFAMGAVAGALAVVLWALQ